MAVTTVERPGARSGVYQRPHLYAAQEAALFHDARYGVIEASTKSGKTVGSMAWLLEQALVHRAGAGRAFWWVAPIFAQAKIPYRRFKRGLPRGAYVANETELTLTLPTGSILGFKGGDQPDSLYGEDVYAAVIDEASRVKEASWHAVRSTLTATRGPVRLIGNVHGRRNWFYTLARRAEAAMATGDDPAYHYAKITAQDAVAAGVLAAAEVADAQRTLPADVFGELYLAEPSDDGGNPFGLAAIAAGVGPLSLAPPAVFGVDLAKSIDWTVVVGLDAHGTVCTFERFQAPWEETTRRVLATIGSTPALVDSTGVGDPIVDRLQRAGANVEGYHFTQPSKQRLMEGLAVAIQQHEVVYPGGVLPAELEAFEYEYTRLGVRYSAPPGLHDDAVCALALAVHARGALGATRFF